MAYLDMTNSSHQCPSTLRVCTDLGVRFCAVGELDRSCSTVLYDTIGLRYSQVCGMVTGYPARTISGLVRGPQTNIDSIYVDGVSLTHGNNPRQHIWTFIAQENCGSTCNPLPFMEDDYFCDAFVEVRRGAFVVENPLWDGEDCGDRGCCTFNNPPWFYRQLSQPTTDNIEMRVCRDQNRDDEDISVDTVEIYVQ